jgi:hypothetical protein
MSDDQEEKPIGIGDVKAALEDVFKGCDVETPYAMDCSFHAEVKFDEYEIRIILSGRRSGPDRRYHFRFLQKIVPSGKRRATKLIINEVRTTDEAELLVAIRDAKEYLLGIVHAINRALKRKPVPQVRGVADLLRGD